MENQAPLIDMGQHPKIRANGLGDVYLVGDDVHVVMFKWERIDGVIRKVIAVEVERPIASCRPEALQAWRRMFHLGGGLH